MQRFCLCSCHKLLDLGQQSPEVFRAGAELRQQLDLEAAIITLDKEGMALVHTDGRQQLFPTRPRQVYDITGAGDMVLAMLAIMAIVVAGAWPRPSVT